MRLSASIVATLMFVTLPIMAVQAAGPEQKKDETTQVAAGLLAELRFAPGELINKYLQDEHSLQEFVAGRLLDIKLADEARKRGLDQLPAVAVRRVVGERSDLVMALTKDFEEQEESRLPDIDALAEQRYLAEREKYRIPERIRVAHILLRADVEQLSDEEIAQQRAKIETLRARLIAGEDFAALASEYSEESATAKEGGLLPGLAERGRFVLPFDRAAWSLEVGEVSEVVRTRFGYHLIKLLGKEAPTYQPYAAVKSEVSKQLREQLMAPRRAAFINSFHTAELDEKAAVMAPEIRQELERWRESQKTARQAAAD